MNKSVSRPTFVRLPQTFQKSKRADRLKKKNFCPDNCLLRSHWENNCCHTTFSRYTGKALSTRVSKISCLGASVGQTKQFVSHVPCATSPSVYPPEKRKTLLRMGHWGGLYFHRSPSVRTFWTSSGERWLCLNWTHRKTDLKTVCKNNGSLVEEVWMHEGMGGELWTGTYQILRALREKNKRTHTRHRSLIYWSHCITYRNPGRLNTLHIAGHLRSAAGAGRF